MGAGEGLEVELLPDLGICLGTLLGELRLGGLLRVGFNLPDDFGRVGFGIPREATAEPERGLSFFALAGAAGRAVAYNTLIEGVSGGGPGRPVEHLLGELSLGAGATWRFGSWGVEADYRQVVLSPEFEGQHDSHRYGSARFSIGGPYE